MISYVQIIQFASSCSDMPCVGLTKAFALIKRFIDLLTARAIAQTHSAAVLHCV